MFFFYLSYAQNLFSFENQNQQTKSNVTVSFYQKCQYAALKKRKTHFREIDSEFIVSGLDVWSDEQVTIKEYSMGSDFLHYFLK